MFLMQCALCILKATYGPLGAAEDRPWSLRFVTNQLRKVVQEQGGDKLILEDRMNGVFGDPAPGEPKVLSVHYIQNGIQGFKCVQENSRLLIDARQYEVIKSRTRSNAATSVASSMNSNLPHRNPDILRIILKCLPLFPDRLMCASVCRAWRDQLYEEGLTDNFSVGIRSYHGQPCYLDMPVHVLQMLFNHSEQYLIHLDLSFYEPLSDEIIGPALVKMYLLEDLNLSGCSRLTDASVQLVGSSCPRLRRLQLKRLEHLTDLSVTNIAMNCLSLELFNLSDCCKITDLGLMAIAQNLSNLLVFHSKDLYKVTDTSVSCLLENCGQNLEVLSFWSLYRVTARGLETFQNGTFTKLASLNLGGCWALDDASIRDSVCCCKNLVDLKIRNCHLLTNSCIEYISEHLVKLEHLDLCYLVEITDEALGFISQRLTRLRSLNISHCVDVTSAGVCQLVNTLPQLSELFLAFISKFTDDTIQSLISCLVEKAKTTLNLLDFRGNKQVSTKSLHLLSTCLQKQFKESPKGLFFYDPK